MNQANLKTKAYSLLRNYFDFSERDKQRRLFANPVGSIKSERYQNSKFLLGIVYEPYQYHQHFIKACIEQQISFDVINLHSTNWFEEIRSGSYDGLLVWPNGTSEYLKMAYDSRIKIINDILKIPTFPDYKAIWLYENKIRGYDWLHANGFPTPKTYIYFDEEEAMQHPESHSLPVVMKTNLGASGKGVYIVETLSKFRRLVRRSFAHGLTSKGSSPYAESRGYVFIQDFLQDIVEWRMVRIGDSFFGHQKLISPNTKKHSGSLLKGWERPPVNLLNLLLAITEKGNFRSMNADIFASLDGKYYVNELHTVFGQSTKELMRVDGKAGRFLFKNGEWVFEEGDFVSGHSASARINYFLSTLKK